MEAGVEGQRVNEVRTELAESLGAPQSPRAEARRPGSSADAVSADVPRAGARRRVAFVVCYYPLGVSTMIVNSIELFARRGFDVDVFVDRWNWDGNPVRLNGDTITVQSFKLRMDRWKRLFYACTLATARFLAPLARPRHPRSARLIHYLRNPHHFLFKSWLRRTMVARYDHVFPVEAPSLVALGTSPENIVYFNMELLDWEEGSLDYGKDVVLKTLEFEALSRVSAAVIQNEKRAARFREVNGFDRPLHILPVASMGSPVTRRTDYFRKKFGLPQSWSIVIYSGNIARWAQCLELVQTVSQWPSGTCLVLHTWLKASLHSPYGRAVRDAAAGLPVYFSDDYIDPSDLAESLSSADLAVMFYEPVDTNFQEILFSSNKLGEYLKAGLPVVTNDFPELERFFATHGIGETIRDMNDLPEAIGRVLANLDAYRSNVLGCYQQHYRFERYFDRMFDALYPDEPVLARTIERGGSE